MTGKMTWLVCAQHAAGEVQSLSSACVTMCVAVLADDVIVVGIFLGCWLFS